MQQKLKEVYSLEQLALIEDAKHNLIKEIKNAKQIQVFSSARLEYYLFENGE